MKQRSYITKVLVVVCLLAAFSTTATAGMFPVLYVRGLVMVNLDDPQGIVFAIPKAPGHKVQLTIVSNSGKRQQFRVTGNIGFTPSALHDAKVDIRVPELVRMQELYGPRIAPRTDQRPTTQAVFPRGSVKAVVTHSVSDVRYTFFRTDTGRDLASFQPRKVADIIRVDLSSGGTLNVNDKRVDLQETRELWIEHLPERTIRNGFEDHFAHYLAYILRPSDAQFDVAPRKLLASTPQIPGNSFAMVAPEYYCYPVRLP